MFSLDNEKSLFSSSLSVSIRLFDSLDIFFFSSFLLFGFFSVFFIGDNIFVSDVKILSNGLTSFSFLSVSFNK